MPFCCINKIIYVPLQPFSRVFLIIMPYNIPLRQEHGMSIRPIEARSRIWLEKRPRRPGDGTGGCQENVAIKPLQDYNPIEERQQSPEDYRQQPNKTQNNHI